MYTAQEAVHCVTLFDESGFDEALVSKGFVPNLEEYAEFIVCFSGGKDSVASVLRLLELGVDPARIEIHHHLVDGRESDLMDWPVTEAYCKAFAEQYGMRFVVTYRQGGIEAEMMRENAPTAPVCIPGTESSVIFIGGKGPLGTRLKFPQVGASLQTRWCSSAAKIDVFSRYINNTDRFNDGQKRLVITGERAEESANRSRYPEFCIHRDNRMGGKIFRPLDHWRPVHKWSEADVWSIIERHGINPHPAYKIGFSRCSCMTCIFIDHDSWATIRHIAPQKFERIAEREDQFGLTIHRTLSVRERAAKGKVMENADKYAPTALRKDYFEPIWVTNWSMPAGAFKSNGGNF